MQPPERALNRPGLAGSRVARRGSRHGAVRLGQRDADFRGRGCAARTTADRRGSLRDRRQLRAPVPGENDGNCVRDASITIRVAIAGEAPRRRYFPAGRRGPVRGGADSHGAVRVDPRSCARRQARPRKSASCWPSSAERRGAPRSAAERRAAPSSAEQRRAAPSSAEQRRAAPSSAEQRRAAPSSAEQRRAPWSAEERDQAEASSSARASCQIMSASGSVRVSTRW